ncbi:hypothetical protein [Sphingomonas sp. XXL09]|uniref:hypothetical protein n=1 Tax=Sphingomonas sp. XXL09 TaxID=3457787 RepID=UPI00406BAED0
MCNLYSIKTDPRGYFDALAAAEDPGNSLAVEKDYAAPASPASLPGWRARAVC